MKKILVFTDVHYCTLDGSLDFARDRFEQGLAHAQKYHSDADLLVVTGDLTNKGNVEAFEAFSKSFEKCTLPNVLMIGNHDNRENFLSVFPDSPKNKDGFIQHAIETEHAKLLFLDTLFGPPYDYPRSHAGFLCEKRLEWLDQELASAGDKPAIIFMHHTPHKVGFVGMDTIKLINTDEFYEVIERHNNVSQIIAGHVHRTISGSHRGVPFAVFKSTQMQMPLLLDSFDMHVSVDEPPAYGLILLGKDGITIHTEDFSLTDYEKLQS